MSDTHTAETGTVTIPLKEWQDHVKRVEFLVNLMNGILAGMAQHPMGRMMMPPEALMQLQATLPQDGD